MIIKDEEIKIGLKSGKDLTVNEFTQIKDAIFREFHVPFDKDIQTKNKLFFLLKRRENILSMGALMEVKPVIFDGMEYVLYGFVNVVANEKGKGYGKQVISAMKKYLQDHDKTGLGFCMPKNTGFYEKCGFKTNPNSTHRFVYLKGSERITNKDGQIIFYQDSSDRFMEKVLANPDKEVYLPTQNLW